MASPSRVDGPNSRLATTGPVAPPDCNVLRHSRCSTRRPTGTPFSFLDAATIDYLEVDGNYVTIHVGDDRFLTRTTLKHLSTLLASSDFVRIDRSLLVNLRRVEYVERLEGGQFSFKLRQGQQLKASRERAGWIVKLLRSAVR